MTYSFEQLKNQFEKLPEDLKIAMTSVEVAETLQKIGAANNLHIDQVGDLAEQVGFVMLGLVPPSGFLTAIKNSLRLSQGQAEAITRDVDQKVFKPISQALHQIHPAGHPDSRESSLPPLTSEKITEDKIISLFQKNTAQAGVSKTEEIDLSSKSRPAGSDPYRELPE